MKLVIVRPLNDQNGRKYLFESEFDDTPYTAKNIKPGAQPKGVIRREDSKQYHDIIVYSRPLTQEEEKHYDLVLIRISDTERC